jgi:HD-GYP domain-containing protein (c-di-GMP phosphodiesterase class II)
VAKAEIERVAATQAGFSPAEHLANRSVTHRNYSSSALVHRALIHRLLIASLLVAALFAGISYFRTFDRIGEDVLQHARNEIEWIRFRVRDLLAGSGLSLKGAVERAMREEPERAMDRRHGRFVFAQFYFDDGESIAQWVEEDGGIAPGFRQGVSDLPRSAVDRAEVGSLELDGRSFVELRLPVSAQQERQVIAHALFAVSDAARAEARRNALVAAAYVVGIVLLTALLLYPIIAQLLQRITRYSEGLLSSNLETLQVLGSAIAKKDSDTDAHNYRVTLYSVRLAEAAGLDDAQIRALIKGAFLHDVGKIGIRDDVLLKPGRLDEDEFDMMKTHVDHGLDIVARSRWLDDAADVVGYHHEKFDGSGYPAGRSGGAIPIGARIFAIADVFDALASQRPYKEPFSFEETMQILHEGRGSHFDPNLLDSFTDIAEGLYRHLAGRDDPGLRQEVEATIERYFKVEPDTSPTRSDPKRATGP